MKRKIAIVGGGMAGLAAAFNLTRTKALQEQFEVTIYQLGWRLGGKVASGRRSDGRIVEHGLHIWFGCYENAFALVRATYKEWDPKEGQTITEVDEAFEAKSFTVMGSGAGAAFSGIMWPEMPGNVGKGHPHLTLWPCITQLLEVIKAQYHYFKPVHFFLPPLTIPPNIVLLMIEANVLIDVMVGGGLPHLRPVQADNYEQCLAAAHDWAASLTNSRILRSERQLRGFVSYLRLVSAHLWNVEAFKDETNGPFLRELIEVGTALVAGVVIELVLGGVSFAELDLLDFREWLCGMGARRDAVYGSSLVQSLYDAPFEYVDGDKRRPSFGAGSACQTSLRLFGSYRGAFAYEPVAGLGEVVVAPIYEVLRARGVCFKFFHKLTRIELNKTLDGVAQIHFDRQVDLVDGTYDPTIPPNAQFCGLEHWPDCPRWDQIKDGDTLKKLDLDSYWCDQSIEPVPLRQGKDFDEVVLAIPVGAFKPLNTTPGPCYELIAASTRFRRMADAASLAPTISVQLWCVPSLTDLGWPPVGVPSVCDNDDPLSCGPPPLSIWADRSVVLDNEYWPDRPPPGSVQYLCDTFETSLYKAPPECIDAPLEAHCRALGLTVKWLEERSCVLWPAASPNDVFDWNVLYDPEGRCGAERINYQIVKANIDPSACCTGSPAGSTRWRLRASRSGFRHLYLAGSWIDTGFNVESIETAVISGKQAARAIIGGSDVIYGEDFLHFDRRVGGWIRELAFGAEAVAEAVFGLALGANGPYRGRNGRRRRQGGGRQ